jgi:glutathione S-transferase
MADKVKLHRCPFTFLRIPGHPCHKVQKALDDRGIEYEIVKHGRERREVVAMTGQKKLPFLELQDGEIYREESREMAARISAGGLGSP